MDRFCERSAILQKIYGTYTPLRLNSKITIYNLEFYLLREYLRRLGVRLESGTVVARKRELDTYRVSDILPN